MKKRAISLIEVVISMGLLSLLLGTLFFWYHSFGKQKEEFILLKNPLMEERYAYQRLQTILPAAELPLFTTANNSLVFIYDRGLSKEPKLSGKVLARLYYDHNQQCLCLGLWPKPTKEKCIKSPSETHILLDGITDCVFDFYYPLDPLKKPVDPEQVGHVHPKTGWQNTWENSYHALPALIKICLTRASQKGLEEHECKYVFELPVPIAYSKDAA